MMIENQVRYRPSSQRKLPSLTSQPVLLSVGAAPPVDHLKLSITIMAAARRWVFLSFIYLGTSYLLLAITIDRMMCRSSVLVYSTRNMLWIISSPDEEAVFQLGTAVPPCSSSVINPRRPVAPTYEYVLAALLNMWSPTES